MYSPIFIAGIRACRQPYTEKAKKKIDCIVGRNLDKESGWLPYGILAAHYNRALAEFFHAQKAVQPAARADYLDRCISTLRDKCLGSRALSEFAARDLERYKINRLLADAYQLREEPAEAQACTRVCEQLEQSAGLSLLCSNADTKVRNFVRGCDWLFTPLN